MDLIKNYSASVLYNLESFTSLRTCNKWWLEAQYGYWGCNYLPHFRVTIGNSRVALAHLSWNPCSHQRSEEDMKNIFCVWLTLVLMPNISLSFNFTKMYFLPLTYKKWDAKSIIRKGKNYLKDRLGFPLKKWFHKNLVCSHH